MPRQDFIQIRRGTAAQWTTANPVLGAGEPGFETDTLKQKVGDGTTAWTSLSYLPTGGGSATWGGITGTLSTQTDLNTALTGKVSVSGAEVHATATGTNTYAATLSPAPAYATGLTVRIKFTNANTGASTINLNSLGAKAIKKNVTTDLASGDIPAGAIVELIYDGTNFQAVGIAGGGVTSVNGDGGPAVSLVASEIPSSATGGVSATNVQAAIAELDTDKQNALGFTPENIANKATTFGTINDTLYPSVKAVNDKINTAIEGLKPKSDARIATTANITLSGLQTIDGVLTVAGDRVLVKDQTTQSQNGIYVAAVGAWSRTTDTDTATEIQGAVVSVDEGSTNLDTTWRQTADNITLGTTAIVWVQYGSATPDATPTTKGKAKLFASTGSGTDGAMDQNSTTTALGLKVNRTDFVPLTDGSTIAWNQQNEQTPLAKITLGASGHTLNITNAKSGGSGIIQVTNGIAGANTLNFDNSTYTHKTDNGTFTSYPLPAGSGVTYDLSFYVDGTTIKWLIGVSNIDTDPIMAADSDLLVPSQKAVNTKFATKENVGVAQALDNLLPWKYVRARTTAALPTNTANGAYTIITMSAVGIITVDGQALLLGDRVMIADEVDQKKNGIFDVTTEGTVSVAAVFTRSSDANSGAKLNGVIVNVQRGTLYGGGSLWFQATITPTFGTSNIIFQAIPTPGGSAVWGGITGTPENQTDLNPTLVAGKIYLYRNFR